jgi:hypothetical protein
MLKSRSLPPFEQQHKEEDMKIRLLRGITIAEAPHHTPGKGEPPTFAAGDVVEVSRVLGQELIGNGKAVLVGKEAPAEPEVEPEVETATATPPEAAVETKAAARKAG